jgi:hypothetical protein
MRRRLPGYSTEHRSWFIPLTQGVIALVDADMVDRLAAWNWFAMRVRRAWVAGRNVPSAGGQRKIYMHRAIMSEPDGLDVDHKKHRPMAVRVIDNRRKNLRACTNQQNARNARPRPDGTSAYKGVNWHKGGGKWQARIHLGGTRKFLGLFIDEMDAARAYDAAALEHFGDFALVNKA